MSANPMALIRIVDDEEDMRNSLKFLLEAEGWTVQLYSSADEFLEQDNKMIPGCLILDIRMLDFRFSFKQTSDTECRFPSYLLQLLQKSERLLWP